MPDIKEKLVELLAQCFHKCLKSHCAECEHFAAPPIIGSNRSCQAHLFADVLIANGVTIVESTYKVVESSTDGWISVEERLPNAIEWVLCAHAGGFIEVLRYDHIMDDWDTTVNNRCRSRESVTHWMPLPEPPKGE